jgi:hypothetical protein
MYYRKKNVVPKRDATTTPCNRAACHQYAQCKKSIVYNTSYDSDINEHVIHSMDIFSLPGDA